GNPVPPFLQGWALVSAGKDTEGKKLIELAKMLPLGDDGARSSLAEAMIKHNLRDDARAQWQLGLRFSDFDSPFNDISLHALADDAVARGEFLQAADYWQQSLLPLNRVRTMYLKTAAYVMIPHLLHRLRARGYIAAEKFDLAQKEIDQCIAA